MPSRQGEDQVPRSDPNPRLFPGRGAKRFGPMGILGLVIAGFLQGFGSCAGFIKALLRCINTMRVQERRAVLVKQVVELFSGSGLEPDPLLTVKAVMLDHHLRVD